MSDVLDKPFLTIFVLSVGLLAGVALTLLKPAPEHSPEVEWLETPRPIASFNLDTASGPFAAQQLLGSWHLLVFGYTQCPDICLTSLTELKALVEATPGLPLTVVFISVDSQNDPIEQLAQYVHYFHDSFTGATAGPPELNALADALGIRFKLPTSGSDDEIAHSTTLSLIGPGGMLRGRLRPGFDMDTVVTELSSKLLASR